MVACFVLPLGVLGGWEIALIAVVILLLFGGKKIPELMRGLGKGVKSFKAGMSEVEDEARSIRDELERPSGAKAPDEISKPGKEGREA